MFKGQAFHYLKTQVIPKLENNNLRLDFPSLIMLLTKIMNWHRLSESTNISARIYILIHFIITVYWGEGGSRKHVTSSFLAITCFSVTPLVLLFLMDLTFNTNIRLKAVTFWKEKRTV